MAVPPSLRPWEASSRRGNRHLVPSGHHTATSQEGSRRPPSLPATSNASGDRPRKEDLWQGFEQRRHRMNPPPDFNESSLKFDKFGSLSFDAKFDDFVSANTNGDEEAFLSTLQHSAADSEKAIAVKDIELAKARFFDLCLRADRSMEQPKPPTHSYNGLRIKKTPPDGPIAKLPGLLSSPMSARETRETSMPQKHVVPSGTRGTEVGADGAQQHTAARKASVSNNALSVAVVNHGNSGQEDHDANMGLDSAASNGKVASPSDSMNHFMVSCKLEKIHPATTGIIRAEGEDLTLQYGCMTDRRTQAIIETLKASSSEVKSASFRSNGLTEVGARNLLNALPDSIQKIDISQNDLGHGEAIWCECFRKHMQLKVLRLADCQIGDSIGKALCESLGACRSLASLNLSGNNLYMAAKEIASLIRHHGGIECLDLHWNHISGEPARTLCASFYDNYQVGGNLHDVNLAWNPLGKISGDETCRQLAQVFAETKCITHMDLSKCDLRKNQCQILADGLRENKTLLGLHIQGNEAYMNTRGFIVPRGTVAASSDFMVGAPGIGAGLQNDVDDHLQRSISVLENEQSGCWICERWRETRITYTAGVSGPDVPHLWVFTSIDNFEQATKMTRQGADFVTLVMAPAGVLKFVFQVGVEIIPSRTAPMQTDLFPKPRIRRVSMLSSDNTTIASAPGHEGTTGCISLDEDDAEVEIHTVSCKMVSAREPDEPVCQGLVPRRPGELQEELEPAPWDIEHSLFAPFEEPLGRRSFCEKCFEADWRVSSVSHVLKDDADRAEVKEILRKYYADIKVLFASLCSLDRGAPANAPFAFGMGIYEYTHFLAQHNLIGEGLSLELADAHFLIATTPPKEEQQKWHDVAKRGGRVLLRHGFGELMLRLALCMYAPALLARPGSKDSKQRGKARSARHALDLFMNKHIMYPYPPAKNNFKCVQWRIDVLQQETVENVFKTYLKSVIDPLFIEYSSNIAGSCSGLQRNVSTTHSARAMLPEGWFALLDTLEVLKCDGDDERALMNTWDRSWIWQISAMAHIDEHTTSGHLQLSFVEFLEALARLVGLLRARRRLHERSFDEQLNVSYGMDLMSPPTIFCIDEEVMSTRTFAKHLDAFFRSESVRNAARQ